MKLHHTQYKKNYQNYILDTVNLDFEEKEITTRQDKINYIFDRFLLEMDFNIKRSGKLAAMTEWLQGPALDIPIWNNEIIPLAKKMGSVDDNITPRQEEKIIDNYWSFMANIVLGLEKEYN